MIHIKKALLTCKNLFSKNFQWKKTLICMGILFVAFASIFPVGALTSETANEVCAEYYANISKNHTTETGDKNLSGLVVQPKPGKDAKMRHDTDVAITELWGVFKGENASFAPVMNANRENEIYFSDQEFSEESLSLVYTNIGQSTEPYHIDKKTKKPIDYKFQSSPLALMFPSALSGMQDKCHIYISQAQAERKLKEQKVEVIDYNALKSLLKTEISLEINGTSYDCVIDNIYLDNFKHAYHFSDYNYYYATDIGTIIGDFVFVILYANKANVFPDKLTRQSLYVMSEYSFRNQFYLSYAKEAYSSEKYSFDYVRSNLKNNFEPDQEILTRTVTQTAQNNSGVFLTILCVLAFCLAFFLIVRYKLLIQPLSLLLCFASIIVPFLTFKIIFSVVGNIYLFSSFSLMLNMILILVFIFGIILLNCLFRVLNLEKKHD